VQYQGSMRENKVNLSPPGTMQGTSCARIFMRYIVEPSGAHIKMKGRDGILGLK
jgi:hypothetical protein